MEFIYEANDEFNFEKLSLMKPSAMPGGNYFIRMVMNNTPLYIQTPKCKTKQGIITAGKKMYSDLLFSNENDQFIRWMENLESHCQKYIYKNREQWFEGEMELHDIENYFTSPLKSYKSGKCYTIRTNITTILGKISLKIYDENESEVGFNAIDDYDSTNMITILEIQGIKCSSRSFQIEIELKQIMILKQTNLFEKCIIKTNHSEKVVSKEVSHEVSDYLEKDLSKEVSKEVSEEVSEEVSREVLQDHLVKDLSKEVSQKVSEEVSEEVSNTKDIPFQKKEETIQESTTTQESKSENLGEQQSLEKNQNQNPNDIEEVELHLEDVSETIQIKQRNDVYYEMYREAKQKAKIARDLALSSYLEAKRIKNTYMLDDIKDSDESDLEFEEEESHDS